MKALSLWQPWATLIAIGAKTVETRSWSTDYRGPLLIHAAKHKNELKLARQYPFSEALARGGYPWKLGDLPLGVCVALCDLVAVDPTELVRDHLNDWEIAFGDYSPGRFAWKLANIRPIHSPIIAGKQGLFEVDPCAWPLVDQVGVLQQMRMFP